MRTLVNRERNAVHEFLNEIGAQLTTARASTDRATDGRTDVAHIELDFAHSALAEIRDIADVLTGYLDRLIVSTERANQATSGHGLVPPKRDVYTIEDDEDDGDAAETAAPTADVAA